MASPDHDAEQRRYQYALYQRLDKYRAALERTARYFRIVIGHGCIPAEWDRDVVNDAIEELYFQVVGTPLDALPADKVLYARLCGIVRCKIKNLVKHHNRVVYNSDELPTNRSCCPTAEHTYDFEVVLRLLERHFSSTDYHIIMLAATGYTAHEIGNRLNMSPECVRQHIARIRAKLRALINEQKTGG